MRSSSRKSAAAPAAADTKPARPVRGSDPLQELNNLVGLAGVKAEVTSCLETEDAYADRRGRCRECDLGARRNEHAPARERDAHRPRAELRPGRGD